MPVSLEKRNTTTQTSMQLVGQQLQVAAMSIPHIEVLFMLWNLLVVYIAVNFHGSIGYAKQIVSRMLSERL